jgi:hypothetical protein
MLAVLRALAVLSLLAFVACDDGAPPRAVRGVVDLRSWHFDDSQVLSLQGQWLIYWDRLVEPAEDATPDGALAIGTWDGRHLDDGRAIGGMGYATYRLRVRLPAEPRRYAIALAPMVDAARLVVSRLDGQLLADPISSGTVGPTAATSYGALTRAATEFTGSGDVLVTLQVSNFVHAKGGWGAAPLLGTMAELDRREHVRRMIDFFILGILLVIGLHYLLQFAMNRTDRPAMWFALLCLTIAGRLVVTGNYATDLSPTFSTTTSIRLEYLTIYVGVPLAGQFMRAVFPRYIAARAIRALVVVSAVFLVTIVLPPSIFTRFITAYQVVILIAVSYTVFGLIRALIGERDLPPALVLAGFVALAGCVARDILNLNSVVVSLTSATPYGLTGFVLAQSALLALLNRRRGRELEQRNRDVQLLNDELRSQIANRSHELSHALALMASPNTTATNLEPGTTLAGKYLVARLIGEGGMGKVYCAERLTDGRAVAVKLVRGGDPRQLSRFAREAELVARINHPNVVEILDFGITETAVLFLVMELVEGNSLELARERFGDLTWAVPMVAQLAKAVAAIHELGVIHRDIKPANVLVSGDTLKLTDFGVAQVTSPVDLARSEALTGDGSADAADPDETASLQPALTRAGMLIGSPLYMAPELGHGAEHATPRSDVFSLGFVAYEMLTGRRPFDRPLVKIGKDRRPLPDPSPPVASLVPDLPAELAALVDRCLHFSPTSRPDAAVVARAFGTAHLQIT